MEGVLYKWTNYLTGMRVRMLVGFGGSGERAWAGFSGMSAEKAGWGSPSLRLACGEPHSERIGSIWFLGLIPFSVPF